MDLRIVSLLVFFLVPIVSTATDRALAADDSAQIVDMLQERDQEIKDLLGPKGTSYTPEKKDKIKDIINGVIDYRAMSSFALQDTWTELDEDQKSEFVDVFSQIVRDQSMNKLDIYRADVSYQRVKITGDSATVTTLAVLEDVRTPVSYTMKKDQGEWVVTDFSIDNVSTAKSYRRSFQNIIRRKGYDALIKSLRKRADRA